ncbi:GNAT family N-acetyltransferase [Glycomyces sp. NPDC048151]|uniref:GNAT family N-acetyltransferase n=1 Tax=Glycomyces sp. NPDC048151 TaxID=3364002 RepID=UPI003721F9A6
MELTTLRKEHIPALTRLMEQGEPYVRVRGESDYWLYSALFADTCPIMIEDGQVIGAVLAFHSQVDSFETYIQDVMVHPDHRRKGIASKLIAVLADRTRDAGRTLIYLTSEPDNTAAHETWTRLGFQNRPGTRKDGAIEIIENFKGAGKDRAVYDLDLSTPTAS